VSTIAGCVAGILGVTGLWGFLFCFIINILSSILLILKAKNKKISLFLLSKLNLLTEGLFQGIMSYVLFWTLLYGIVHVF